METTFQSCLTIGKNGEAIAKKILERNGWNVIDLSDDKAAQQQDIDFAVSKDGRQHTLEIKNQVQAKYTNNVFIETYTPDNVRRNGQGYFYYCSADFMGFVVSDQLHIVHWGLLKEVCKQCRKVSCKTGEGYIVPIDLLKNIPGYSLLK